MTKITFILFFLMASPGLFGQVGKSPENKKNVPDKTKIESNKAKTKGGPVTANDFYRIGTECQEVNDIEGAMDGFNKALEQDPKFFPAYLSRGKLRFVQQEFENAVQDFNKTIEITEKLIGETKKKGNIKIILGNHKGAAKDFYFADSMKPVLGEAIFNRGNVKHFLNDSLGCCEDLRKSGDLGYVKSFEYLKKYCQ